MITRCLIPVLLLIGAGRLPVAASRVGAPRTHCVGGAVAPPDSLRLKITVDGRVYTARFVDSETTHAFIRLLPLTLRLGDLNGREKYGELPARLPATGPVRTSYQPGDISYWRGGGLAAFYHQDGHQVQAGLVVLARLIGGTTPFAGPGPVKATFEAVAP